MTEAERDIFDSRAQSWFDENFDGNACIMCTSLGTLRIGAPLAIAVIGNPLAVWYVVIECTKCGHTLFYNAEITGVIDGP